MAKDVLLLRRIKEMIDALSGRPSRFQESIVHADPPLGPRPQERMLLEPRDTAFPPRLFRPGVLGQASVRRTLLALEIAAAELVDPINRRFAGKRHQ